MFPVKISTDLSYVQLWLLHWIQVYDWAFALPEGERPIDLILEDDKLFDQWYTKYSAQKKSEARKASASRGGAGQHDNVITFD
jgi:hypothetical protein